MHVGIANPQWRMRMRNPYFRHIWQEAHGVDLVIPDYSVRSWEELNERLHWCHWSISNWSLMPLLLTWIKFNSSMPIFGLMPNAPVIWAISPDICCPMFEYWLWRYRYFWNRVNVWNVDCVRATSFIFRRHTNRCSCESVKPWRRHQMEKFSALLAICAGNSPVSGEFPAQRPVTRSFGVFFDLRLNERWSKQSWGWWFETLSNPLWRHCNATVKSVTTQLVSQRLLGFRVVSFFFSINPDSVVYAYIRGLRLT